MEQRVSLITLGVADLARSRRFYENGLGWKRSNNHDEVAFYQTGGSVLALFSRTALAEDGNLADEGAAYGGIVLAHNARSREEVDAVIDEAAGAGAKILKPAVETFWGGYAGYFADPDGHVWEVAWNPDWTIRDDGSVSLSG